MKKWLTLILAVVLMTGCLVSSASAAFYQQRQSNGATFETLEEAHVNGSAWLYQEYGRDYMGDAALDNYPVGTTYVYRAPGMYNCVTGAVRMNTNLLVYTDKKFEDKDAAFAYLKDAGLTDIADEAIGSIVLVTPIGKTFGMADQYAYFQLQSAMCNIGYRTNVDGKTYYSAEQGYFGGLTYRYLIGDEGGATFINNYIATSLDNISRIAGLLLYGGTIEKIREVAGCVPTWIVNANDMVVGKYAKANATDSKGRNGDDQLFYNSKHPLQQVIVTDDADATFADSIQKAYYGMFIHAMRIPVINSNLYTDSKLYADYKFNQVPYSLGERNPIINGVTPDGIHVIQYQDDQQFSAYASASGEFVTTWYELLPEEVLDGTAPEHSIPLLLCNHGGGDDPIQAVEEMGWLTKAGQERIAILAERHGSDASPSAGATAGGSPFSTMEQVLPPMVEYMLAKYPALDPSRVYVTGYSQGGGATCDAIAGKPGLFAAAVDMSGQYAPKAEKESLYANLDIPVMLTTSTYDTPTKWDAAAGHLVKGYQDLLSAYMRYNEIPEVTFDYDRYPMSGIKGDVYRETTINDEYPLYTWSFLNDQNVPMVSLAIIEFIPHGLYQEYANLAWDFMKPFSRNPETLEIEYRPY